MGEALLGRVAIVTGAGRGIGAATARLLSSQGARVVLVSRSLDELEVVAKELHQGGSECHVIQADVSEEKDVLSIFAQTHEQFGCPDILINNAAIIEVTPFAQIELAEWERVMAVNVRGPFLCCREMFRRLIASKKSGVIVNVGSLSGVRGPEKFPGFGSYVVSKYGVLGLTDILAVEGRPHGIRVNCVSPGAVDTAMLKKAAPFLQTKTTPADVAETILYLVDEARSGRVTGANVEIFSNA